MYMYRINFMLIKRKPKKSAMRTIRVMKIPGSEFSSVNWMLRSNRARSKFCCTTTTRPKTVLYLIFISTEKVQLG